MTLTKRYRILLSTIHSVYRLMNSTFNIRDLVIRLARLICQVTNTDYCMIILLDPTKKYAVFRSVASKRQRYLIDKKSRITNPVESRIIKSSSAMHNEAMVIVPLIADDVIGLIILRHKKRGTFDFTDQKILMILAEQSVMGIRNLQLYEEQQKIVLGSIKSLVTLLDSRIPSEYTHSPYFGRLVTAIAHQMRLNERELQSLQYASMLHDAGKIDIPMEILTKTAKLTPKEINIIKCHPLKGAQILRNMEVLRPAIPIIMHHHERYDGTGYPSKLKKGQIPLGARIMAVADAFEAMVYGRPYRERINIPSAIKEIRKKNGTQFDPKVVDAFLRAIKLNKFRKYLKYNK